VTRESSVCCHRFNPNFLDARVRGHEWCGVFQGFSLSVERIEMPDGALLVSDDRAGALYRISYAQ